VKVTRLLLVLVVSPILGFFVALVGANLGLPDGASWFVAPASAGVIAVATTTVLRAPLISVALGATASASVTLLVLWALVQVVAGTGVPDDF
jgi:hypothetical protein